MNTDSIVTLKKGEGRGLKTGGLWVFDNEISDISGSFKNGDIVRVEDFDGYPMGRGFINQNSKIRIRMLSRRSSDEITGEFLQARVQTAWNYRKAVMGQDLNCARLIFGEADWLPGLVVDKYGDYLVTECLALGMDRLKETVLDALIDCLAADGFPITAVYERSDAPVRKKEGMMPFKGLIWHKGSWLSQEELAQQASPEGRRTICEKYDFSPETEICENGVFYRIDVENGQKTGFFLDQKYNRRAMQDLCRNIIANKVSIGQGEREQTGLRVLDCFTHMGTFALNCGLAGAGDVTGLDISDFAVSQARANARRNGLEDRVHFRTANVLDELPRLNEAEEQYDLVILDPPAFTKSREATKNAIKGYREINIKGLKLVKDGGYFATCSCSHFMTQELFTQTVAQAAKSAHKRLRQIEFRTQAPDHPILWAADESYYLKFLIFQVCEEK